MSAELWESIHASRPWGLCPEPMMARWACRAWQNPEDRFCVSIADIGCGNGAQMRFLRTLNFNVVGFDVAQSAVDRVRNDGLTAWRWDLSDQIALNADAAYYRGRFDGAVDVCSLQHMRDYGAALANVFALLKPNGRLFSMWAAETSSDPAGEVGFMKRLYNPKPLFEFFTFRIDQIDQVEHTDGEKTFKHWCISARKPR